MKFRDRRAIDWLFVVPFITVGFVFSSAAQGEVDPSLAVSLTRSNKNVVLHWNTLNTVPYQVEASSTLTAWTNLSAVLTGTGSPLSFTHATDGAGPTFFRVKRVFPSQAGNATFNPATGLLTVVGDVAHTVIGIAPDGAGNINVNGGNIPITGGTPTLANTILIQVLGSTADDQITIANGLPPAHLFGAAGNDILTGGSGNDLLVGGPGADTLIGGRGADVLYPDGDDLVVWNPGDGSDVIQGAGDNNTLLFNGANVGENIALSANGSHLRFTRDVGNITLDINGVQTINVNVLGGSDNIIVNPLAGTGVARVNVDLAAVPGTSNGDGQPDMVTLNGTPGPDTINIAANGDAVDATGLGALVHVLHAELANDRIVVTGLGGDRVNVNGTEGPDIMQVVPSPVAGFARALVSGFTVPVDVAGALTLSVNGLGGPDTITCANGLAALGIPLILDGGDGDDTITGGDGGDTILGGPGNDIVSGGRGNDIVLLGDGDDTFIWNPGDGSDVVEGQGGNDVVAFNGANVNEQMDVSSNGSRVRFFRDVGNVTLDMNGVETLSLVTLGGADVVRVNNLAGTALARVNIDLAGVPGTTNGDGQADQVIINGLAGADTFNIAASGAAVEVTGVGALVHVVNGELANDRIVVNGLGGDLVNVNGSEAADVMQVLPSPVAGFARVIVAGFTVPVDVSGALTLAVNGLGGPDTITGANGFAALGIPLILDGGDGDDTIVGTDANDTIYGGPGNDIVTGGRGNDTVFLGDGDDRFVWNPGDGSDVVEGEGGTDTLAFNGSNVGERMDLSSNRSRLRLFRDVGNITLDVNGMELVNILALAGADTITVNDLTGIGVTTVSVDLGIATGAGDLQADTVIVNGTAAPDTINVTTKGGEVLVGGLAARVLILHPELGLDNLIINGLGGVDALTVGPGVTTVIGVTLNQ